MSHELRTPLNAIIGDSDLMEAGVSGTITPMQEESLERITESSRHLLRMVDEILMYSRMESGQEEVHPTRFEISPLVRDVFESVESLASDKSLDFKLRQPEHSIAGDTDRVKVRRILLNLLYNAVKFTDRGTVEVAVRLESRKVMIEVSDTARGIPREHLKRVFEPFWQVEQSATRSVGGTGLGASASRSGWRSCSAAQSSCEAAMRGRASQSFCPRQQRIVREGMMLLEILRTSHACSDRPLKLLPAPAAGRS